MSKGDDSDDKITVLFPGADENEADENGAGESGGEESPQGEMTEQQEEDAGKLDEAVEEDNVVRLDFDHDETTRRSPRPVQQGADDDEQAPAKLAAFSEMIEEGMVMVTLDPRRNGVQVPPKFSSLPELRLNFSYMFHINDFDFDAQGVRASLSFQGQRYFTDIPWSAVFMLYSHESGDVAVFEPDESP